jgi:hypothetical protein
VEPEVHGTAGRPSEGARDVPVKEREDWEAWLAARQVEHWEWTREILRLEMELNSLVYGLFALTTEEIAIVEESTKYRYGEV